MTKLDLNTKTKPNNVNAVATVYGWVDAKQGDLLVGVKGLKDALDWDRRANTFTDSKGKTVDPLAPAPAPAPAKTSKKAKKEEVTETQE